MDLQIHWEQFDLNLIVPYFLFESEYILNIFSECHVFDNVDEELVDHFLHKNSLFQDNYKDDILE